LSRKWSEWDDFVFTWGLNPIKKIKEVTHFYRKWGWPINFRFIFMLFSACIPILSRLEWELEVRLLEKELRRLDCK